MENKLNLPQKKKKNEAESPRLDPLMRALKALHSASAPQSGCPRPADRADGRHGL